MRARKVRADRGKPTVEARGALGISREMLEEGFKERRTATRAPPALMFNAVENSRNSFPSWFFPRTKTGIAKGKRCHFRRSLPAFRPANRAPFCQRFLGHTAPQVPNLIERTLAETKVTGKVTCRVKAAELAGHCAQQLNVVCLVRRRTWHNCTPVLSESFFLSITKPLHLAVDRAGTLTYDSSNASLYRPVTLSPPPHKQEGPR